MAGHPCRGRIKDRVEVRMRAHNHKPGTARTSKGTLYFCEVCGAYGETRLERLVGKQCRGWPTQGGKSALRKLGKREHPDGKGGWAEVYREHAYADCARAEGVSLPGREGIG